MAITFEHHQLDNGLNIVSETDPAAHTASVGFFVRAGSRDEPSEIMGVSHFLEHMVFKGTRRRTAEDVNREFDEIGANYNAYTSQESTVFFGQVLPEVLDRAVDLLGDLMRPALRDEDFEVEKQVILEEIGMYEDRPAFRLQDELIEKYFGNHPLAHRVLGTQETIKGLSAEQMRGYFQQRYGPDSIVVAAAGNLDFKRLIAQVEALAADWQPAGARRGYDEPSLGSSEHTLTDPRLTRHYLAVMSPAPSTQDPRRYAASVLADVIGDTDGSRFYWNLIDPGLADEADFTYFSADHVGSYAAYASCDLKRREQVERILLDTLDGYASSIDEGEIERARNKIATQATVRGENPMGRMQILGSHWLYLNDYLPLEDEVKRILAVDADDVRNVIAQMPFEPRTLVRLGPGE